MPMALLLMKPCFDIWTPGEHTGTFRGNQLSLVSAKAGLEVFINENVAAQVAEKEAIVADFMKNEIEPLHPQITTRGVGLLWGVDLSALGGNDLSKAVMRRCFEKGLVLERVGRDNAVMKLMPTLTVEPELLKQGLTILRDVLCEFVKE